jgi:hypothetical protein
MAAMLTAACPLCGLRFGSKALLELHVREDHPRAPQPQRPAPERTGNEISR